MNETVRAFCARQSSARKPCIHCNHLTTCNAVAHTDHTPGKGWGRVGESGNTNLSGRRRCNGCAGNYGKNCQIEVNMQVFFRSLLLEGKFRFQLKNANGFFRAAVFAFLGALRIFFAAGTLLRHLFCTTGWSCRFGSALAFTLIGYCKKRHRLDACTVAVHLMHTHAHRSDEQCEHPGPGDRFFYNGRHDFLKNSGMWKTLQR